MEEVMGAAREKGHRLIEEIISSALESGWKIDHKKPFEQNVNSLIRSGLLNAMSKPEFAELIA